MKRCRNLLAAILALGLMGQVALAAPKTVRPVNPEYVQKLVRDMQDGVTPDISGAIRGKDGLNSAAPISGYTNQPGGHMSEMLETFPRQLSGQKEVVRYPNWNLAGTISLGESWRDPLDLPTCTLAYGAVDTFSYFAGMTAGDGYKVWVDPALCPGCAPVYPFRVDSLCVQVVQDDGSPADTVFIAIDIECAFGDPSDPCGGPGLEKCFALYSVALPLDTADTFLSLYTVWLPFDSCWVDGPFFAGMFFFGNTVTDTSFFKPNFRLDGGSTPVVPACEAWTNLSGTWSSWADTWIDPDPGYPVFTVAGECNDPNAGPIAPCPNLCTQTRIGAPLAFYDPTTTAVWQWYQESPAAVLSFPYDPQQLDFSLYWYAMGSLQDSVEITIFYGCPRFGDICCAPMDVLCAGSIYITRTATGAGNLVPVSLDLSNFDCCLPENFWVGAAITDAQVGDTLPSFLYSNSTVEVPPPPDCEQWLFSSGAYGHMPSGNLGWWDALLAGLCGDCGAQDPDTCPAPPVEVLDCNGATVIACDANGVILPAQTTIGSPDNVTEYCCTPWLEDGPERVYRITVSNGANVSADISGTTADLDIFILSACNPANCIAAGDSVAAAENLAGGTYYIVVDGFNGAEGNYTLTVTCYPSCATQGVLIADWVALAPRSANTRYTDGEWDASNPDTLYYAWWIGGTATTMRIAKVNLNNGGFSLVPFTPTGATPNRPSIAYDPRGGGQYWIAWVNNLTTGTGTLARVSLSGVVQQSWTSIAGMHSLRFSGIAYNPDHNRIWALIRSAAQAGADTAYCIDVTNQAVPTLVQGPHPLTAIHQSPLGTSTTGGCDYAPAVDKLIVMCQGTTAPGSVDYAECFLDVNPGYSGALPGPGLTPMGFCIPGDNTLQGFGLGAVDNRGTGNLGRIYATDFADGTAPHELNYYDAPCPLSIQRCDSVINLTAYRVGANLQLSFSAPLTNPSATYTAYVAPLYTNVQPPNAPWVPVGSVNGAAGAALTITHPAPFGSTPRMYRIVASCN